MIYKWKVGFGGMDVPEAKRLKGVEDENARLKRNDAASLHCPALILTVAKSSSTMWMI
ncbi:hypothetical protein [Mesorhizobium sp. CAU 1732]|uniref:hypothetical protein n=1 Tax=Mesorhizobium sp. CAU 1732 TaxID=3140358 RepID=UPI0032611EF3